MKRTVPFQGAHQCVLFGVDKHSSPECGELVEETLLEIDRPTRIVPSDLAMAAHASGSRDTLGLRRIRDKIGRSLPWTSTQHPPPQAQTSNPTSKTATDKKLASLFVASLSLENPDLKALIDTLLRLKTADLVSRTVHMRIPAAHGCE